jgi:phosphopantothenoylcysteine synthetase/decarboxylase
MKTIILGVCGSIAAYRSADLAGSLVRLGYTVRVVLTQAATRFITPLTLHTLSRNPVLTDMFEEKSSWHPGHIALADSASLLLVAPATANIIAKLALGLADDTLSSLALVCRAPILLAPAMNGKMWKHPATMANVALLAKRGIEFVGPRSGMLACGYEGIGKLWPVEEITTRVHQILSATEEEDLDRERRGFALQIHPSAGKF